MQSGQFNSNAKGHRLHGVDISLPGRESQPAEHADTSPAQRQEDYDEFKASVGIVQLCLKKTSHAGLELSQPRRACTAPADQFVSSIHVVVLNCL